MKVTLLSLALLLGSCQTTDSVSTHSVSSSLAPIVEAPAATTESPSKAALPRWNHLDRAQFAVRDWVRDRR